MINALIFISVFIIGIVMYFSCYKVNIARFKSKHIGKKILLIGGTHGNEPVGVYVLNSLENLLKNKPYLPKRGEITIIKNLNKCGYFLKNRYYNSVGKKYDINRLYGTDFVVNKQVESIVKNADVIIDIHEGWGYIGDKLNSIGSSISYTKGINRRHVQKVVDLLNLKINEDNKKFEIGSFKTKRHSLREYCSKINKPYILFETTGQNNIQSLNVRLNQTYTFILYMLSIYDMI